MYGGLRTGRFFLGCIISRFLAGFTESGLCSGGMRFIYKERTGLAIHITLRDISRVLVLQVLLTRSMSVRVPPHDSNLISDPYLHSYSQSAFCNTPHSHQGPTKLLTKRIASETRTLWKKRVDAAVLGHLLVHLLIRGHQPACVVVDIDALAPDGIEGHHQFHHGCFTHFNLCPELLIEWHGAVGSVDEDVGPKFGQIEVPALTRCYIVEGGTRR